MSCDTIELGHGVYGVVCSRGRRRPSCSVTGCSRSATHQCDYPLTGRASGRTCSRHLCGKHAMRHSTGKPVSLDLCPTHHELARTTGTIPEQLDLLETRRHA